MRAVETFGESVMFLVYSVVIVVILSAPMLPDETHMGLHLLTAALMALLGVSLYAVALRVAWATVGGKSPVRSFFVTYSYFAGAAIVILTIVALVAYGMVRVFEPEMYPAVIGVADLEPNKGLKRIFELAEDSAVVMAFLVVRLVGLVAIGIWGLIAWGAYRKLNALGRWRSLLAFFIMALLSNLVHVLITFVSASLQPV